MAAAEVTFEDEFADGAVLVIEKKFRTHSTLYVYGAIKEKGKWYITGKGAPGLTPDELVSFILQGWDHDHPPRIYWAPQVVELEVPK